MLMNSYMCFSPLCLFLYRLILVRLKDKDTFFTLSSAVSSEAGVFAIRNTGMELLGGGWRGGESRCEEVKGEEGGSREKGKEG